MGIKRKPVGSPEDWWEAWEEEAKKKGMSRDAWIGACCNARLPKTVKQNLSKRAARGRPKGMQSEDK